MADRNAGTPPQAFMYRGADQPMRRDLGITHVAVAGRDRPVRRREMAVSPFCTLLELSAGDADPPSDILVVAPLSGHFSILLRDLVVGLLPRHRVLVTEWMNARHVALCDGVFDFEANIACIIEGLRQLRPGGSVVAVCQGGTPALAATALAAAAGGAISPAALVLIAAPIDPMANPTAVATSVRAHTLTDIEDSSVRRVSGAYAGAGRRVYPAETQLAALSAYLMRRLDRRGEMGRKLVEDDGDNPRQYPFLDLFTSVMDLDAACFLGSLKAVYHDRALCQGALRFHGERVDLGAIRGTALMTIEGASDDIASPGQTSVAQELCPHIPDGRRHRMVIEGAGHFSLFHGDIWRARILPQIEQVLASAAGPALRPSGGP
ncbi:MAG: hypothetical protein ACOYLQ_19890 [Hyphomicrobiaceae bacterium]